jgi:hypothetical protein
MKKITKKWIKFWRTGIMFAEDWNVDCDEFPHPKDIDWPERAYVASFHKREDIIDDDGIEYQGKAEKVGLNYYHPDSKIEILEEVKKNPNATKTLIDNMKFNKWDAIVWTRWGNFPQPFDPNKDTVIK